MKQLKTYIDSGYIDNTLFGIFNAFYTNDICVSGVGYSEDDVVKAVPFPINDDEVDLLLTDIRTENGNNSLNFIGEIKAKFPTGPVADQCGKRFAVGLGIGKRASAQSRGQKRNEQGKRATVACPIGCKHALFSRSLGRRGSNARSHQDTAAAWQGGNSLRAHQQHVALIQTRKIRFGNRLGAHTPKVALPPVAHRA